MRSFHLLVNPAAGGGSAPATVIPVARLLREAGARVTVTYSQGPTASRATVAQACARGDVLVAVGGDGMVGSLAGPVIEAGGVLAIVPSGRGNDFARQLGLPGDPEPVARMLLEGEPAPVDVIDAVGQVVVGSVYAGVDALASELVNRAHWLPRKLQYPYAALHALARFPSAPYAVTVDGARHSLEATSVVVANSGYYGKGMHIAPSAVVDDGLLDVVVISAASRWRLISSLPKVYAGSHVDLPEVQVLRGREVTVEAGGDAYGDGERLGALPVTARVRPGALTVLRAAATTPETPAPDPPAATTTSSW